MEIVVGFQGKEHVTAGQVGRILAGMAGDGVYVLRTQSQLAASMVTANQVRIGTGDLVMHGRVATVETPETLTVESGVSGQKRSDLVVARYTKDQSTSVEKIELVVVKGTPVSYGDPADPEINEGSVLDGDSPVDVPLWRIPVDGLAPGTPERLFEDAPSSADLRDSVSQIGEVLWHNDAGMFMRASQSVTLSRPVSETSGGIVLLWRQYDDGAPIVGGACCQYVPKADVAAYPGMGHGCLMTSRAGDIIGTKYVYVSDDRIVGHDDNQRNATEMASGLVTTPKAWVLTDVYSA